MRLTIIVGMADLIARDGIPPDVVRDTAREIRESSEHLAGLLESMLMLARADQAEERNFEPLLLAHVVERVVERHRTVHPDRRYRLERRTRSGLVEAYEPWISQVLTNLLGNAEKYGREDGRIVVVLEHADGEVVIRVFDEGEGIASEDLPQVFEPFFRAAYARDRTGGLGLGLAVCRRLVELQGGRIWVSARPEGGSEFGFALPALDARD